MSKQLKTYERPELCALGSAEVLTLGSSGCNADCSCCKQSEPQLY